MLPWSIWMIRIQASQKARKRSRPKRHPSMPRKRKLAALLTRYSEEHPGRTETETPDRGRRSEHRRRRQNETKRPLVTANDLTPPPVPAVPKRMPRSPAKYLNPVLGSQLKVIENEIAKHREEQQRLSKAVSKYQAKLEAIPVREQQITQLVRDYEIAKGHYKQLLEKQMSAETATQLEIRQKGERFSVLDPAQPAERPSRPQRMLLNAGGAWADLALGLLFALITNFSVCR